MVRDAQDNRWDAPVCGDEYPVDLEEDTPITDFVERLLNLIFVGFGCFMVIYLCCVILQACAGMGGWGGG